MNISLLYSGAPREVLKMALVLPDGATVAQALLESTVVDANELEPLGLTLSVWGKTVKQSRVLHEGDRLEVCRPLRVDPKVARRERFALQGSKGAGLFATRRPGAKAGY